MPHFLGAAQINPQDPLSSLNLGNYDLQQGRLQSAVERYVHVEQVTSNPGLGSNALTGLGAVYRQQNMTSEARQSYENALQLEPGNGLAWIGLGLLSAKTGDQLQAENCFSRAVALQPTDVGYLLLAHALRSNGHEAEAQAASQAAQQMSADLNAAQQEVEKLLAQ
jgi:tetratricopeptide (TPR) repeat protein